MTKFESDKLCKSILMEHQLHFKGVKEVFGNFLFNIDVSALSPENIVENMRKMLQIVFSKNSPRRPPQIIILGPPGSGRSTQAKLIA
mmetsp:Transcript_15199/g.25726  ORF Transcript_15199/g.25726 Transcript_15199/m.25726 type:complete len:87 (+) Transcript_15199:567-827(+)